MNSNIIKKYKFRKYRKILILGILVSASVVGISLGIVYSKTSDVNSRKDQVIKLYNQLFVEKNKSSWKIYPSLKIQIEKILNELNSSSNDKTPIYHSSPNYSSYTKKDITICQIDDYGFIKGTGTYSNWGSKIVFLFKNNELMEINYKSGENNDTQSN